MENIKADSIAYSDAAGRRVEISKFGNLIKWVDEQGVDHIQKTPSKSREGYAFLVNGEKGVEAIYDVNDDRSEILTVENFSANHAPGATIPNGETAEARSEVRTSDGKYKIEIVATWTAGDNRVEIFRSIRNMADSPAVIAGVKAHGALHVKYETDPKLSAALGEKITRGWSQRPFDLACIIHCDRRSEQRRILDSPMTPAAPVRRRRMSLPEPDPARAPFMSVSTEDPGSFSLTSDGTAAGVNKVTSPFSDSSAEYKSTIVAESLTQTRMADDYWEVTLGWKVNKVLAKGDSYGFSTSYFYKRPKKERSEK